MTDKNEKVDETINVKGKPGTTINLENKFEERPFFQTTAFKVTALVLTHATVAYLGYQLGKRSGRNEAQYAGSGSPSPVVTESL